MIKDFKVGSVYVNFGCLSWPNKEGGTNQSIKIEAGPVIFINESKHAWWGKFGGCLVLTYLGPLWIMKGSLDDVEEEV